MAGDKSVGADESARCGSGGRDARRSIRGGWRSFPRHRHSKDEEFIVLGGECKIGTQRLVAGDAHFASAGSWHEDITTETGVLVLLRGEYPPPAHV